MEADLSRYHGARWSDRWRRGPDGTRRLTLREIWVRLQFLPEDSAVVKALNHGRPVWSDADYLLSDVFHALTGKAHPARPKPGAEKVATPERRKKLTAARSRARARQAAIAAGVIT